MTIPPSKIKTIEVELETGEKMDIHVYEVRVKDVRKIFEDMESGSTIMDAFNKILATCSNINLDILQELYPSDIEKIYETWQEINRPFLRFLKRDNLMTQTIMAQFRPVISALQKDLQKILSSSSAMGITQLGNTHGVTT